MISIDGSTSRVGLVLSLGLVLGLILIHTGCFPVEPVPDLVPDQPDVPNPTPPDCVVDADCDDSDACTADACIEGMCENTSMVCGDNDRCTENTCVDGACVFIPMDCDDYDACTVDFCLPLVGVCRHEPILCPDRHHCDPTKGKCVPDGTFCSSSADCDDGVYCNGREVCSRDGICAPGDRPCGDVVPCIEERRRCGKPCTGREDCADLQLACAFCVTDTEAGGSCVRIGTGGFSTTFTLSASTTDNDLIIATSGNDVIIGGPGSLQPGDIIDGADGFDRLMVTFDNGEEAQHAYFAADIRNVEEFCISGTAGYITFPPCLFDEDCNDGVEHNGVETCNLTTGYCARGVQP